MKGDGVNTASRLESLTKNKEYLAKIIVSETTLKKTRGEYKTRPLGPVAVKGKSEPILLHALEEA